MIIKNANGVTPEEIFGFDTIEALNTQLGLEGGEYTPLISLVAIVSVLNVMPPMVYIVATLIMEGATGLDLKHGRGDLYEYIEKAYNKKELEVLAIQLMELSVNHND